MGRRHRHAISDSYYQIEIMILKANTWGWTRLESRFSTFEQADYAIKGRPEKARIVFITEQVVKK